MLGPYDGEDMRIILKKLILKTGEVPSMKRSYENISNRQGKILATAVIIIGTSENTF